MLASVRLHWFVIRPLPAVSFVAWTGLLQNWLFWYNIHMQQVYRKIPLCSISASSEIKWRFQILKKPNSDNVTVIVNCCHFCFSAELFHRCPQAEQFCGILYHLLVCWSATHTYTQPFNGPLSRTTRVGQYQKKHLPTHTHPDHQISFINFLHLLQSIASPFTLRAWQSWLVCLANTQLKDRESEQDNHFLACNFAK